MLFVYCSSFLSNLVKPMTENIYKTLNGLRVQRIQIWSMKQSSFGQIQIVFLIYEWKTKYLSKIFIKCVPLYREISLERQILYCGKQNVVSKINKLLEPIVRVILEQWNLLTNINHISHFV